METAREGDLLADVQTTGDEDCAVEGERQTGEKLRIGSCGSSAGIDARAKGIVESIAVVCPVHQPGVRKSKRIGIHGRIRSDSEGGGWRRAPRWGWTLHNGVGGILDEAESRAR